jgi:hypothetical protein
MSIAALWLPILVTAVIIFITGALIWMIMPWHRTDIRAATDEESVRSALKGAAPGMYLVPYVWDESGKPDPEKSKLMEEGPVAYVTVVPPGPPTMGGKLVQNFVYNLLVAVACAYMVSRTLAAGADYLAVFRIAGTTAFIAYGVAYIQESIWFGRQWSTTMKSFLDALIYALLTGGIFGWLA